MAAQDGALMLDVLQAKHAHQGIVPAHQMNVRQAAGAAKGLVLKNNAEITAAFAEHGLIL